MNTSSREKRRHTRQTFQALCFVRLSPADTNKQVVGSLTDISLSGLGFTYLPDTKQQEQGLKPDRTYHLDLFQSGASSFLLSGVQAQLKYSIEKKDTISFLGLPLKRCGLQFLDLSASQEEELKKLLAS